MEEIVLDNASESRENKKKTAKIHKKWTKKPKNGLKSPKIKDSGT
jgi:hypothetical protein